MFINGLLVHAEWCPVSFGDYNLAHRKPPSFVKVAEPDDSDLIINNIWLWACPILAMLDDWAQPEHVAVCRKSTIPWTGSIRFGHCVQRRRLRSFGSRLSQKPKPRRLMMWAHMIGAKMTNFRQQMMASRKQQSSELLHQEAHNLNAILEVNWLRPMFQICLRELSPLVIYTYRAT